MLNYSEFIVGLWLVPVVLCIVTPLAILFLWSIKHILTDIFSSVKRVEGVVTERVNESAESYHPPQTA